MRDHKLKNQAGQIEDEIDALVATIDGIAFKARGEGATDHAEFYDDILVKLHDARRAMEDAYDLLSAGDGLNIEPLVEA